jgi:predicted RND superfamily exporter protein
MHTKLAAAYARYLDLSSRRPWTVLAAIALSTAGLGWLGTRIQVRGDLEDLFPEGTPAVVRAREARALLGSTQELRVLVGGPDREVNRQAAAQLAAFLEARPEVERVEFRRDVGFFEKNGLLYLPLEELEEIHERVTEAIQDAVKQDLDLDEFEAQPAPGPGDGQGQARRELPSIDDLKREHQLEGITEYFESPDGQVVAVKAFPRFKPSDTTRTAALNQAIEIDTARLEAQHPTAGLSFTTDGDYSDFTRAADQVVRDATVSGAWALVLLLVVIVAHFRRFRVLLVTAVVLAVTLGWTLGFAWLTIGYLNLVTSISFTILFGMSVDYIVHGMSRVDEEYQAGVPLATALSRGLLGLARPVFNAMLTTAATFWALVFFDFRGLSQLGIIAGFGVVFALCAFYAAYPPLAHAMHRIWPERPRPRPPEPSLDAPAGETLKAGLAAAPPASRLKKRLAWGVLGTVLGAAAASVVWAQDLRFDPDMGKFRVRDTQAETELKTKYRAAEPRTASPALIVTQDLQETERLHRWLEAHLAEYPVLQEVQSVFAFVPEQQPEKLAVVREVKRKLKNKIALLEGQARLDADRLMPHLDPEPFGPDDLPAWLRAKFTDVEHRYGRYVLLYAHGRKANALEAKKIQDQLGEISLPATHREPARTFHAAAQYFISAEAYQVVRREGPMAALIGLLVVMGVVLFDFRRPRELLMITLPILSSFAIMLGILVRVDLPLDLFNVVVLPQVFGLGIDTATHLTHRIREGGPRVVQHVRSTAVAAGVSSLLTAIGFAALIPVQNQGLQGIGWLAVLGIACAYVVSLVMFTAFLWLGRPAEP